MKRHWIFTTLEGFSVSPNDETNDNLQVVGFASAETFAEAKEILLKEYPNIQVEGFQSLLAYELTSLIPDSFDI